MERRTFGSQFSSISPSNPTTVANHIVPDKFQTFLERFREIPSDGAADAPRRRYEGICLTLTQDGLGRPWPPPWLG